MPKKASAIKGEKPSGPLCVDGLTLDPKKRQVTTRADSQKLTPKECHLLEVFMRNPGKVLTRKFLMKEVWETDYLGDTRTLDVHISWLRRKIEEDPYHPQYLRTVHGVGYRFGKAK